TDSTAGCCDLKPPSRRVARVRDRTMLPTKFHLAIACLCMVLPSGRDKVVFTLMGSSNARLQPYTFIVTAISSQHDCRGQRAQSAHTLMGKWWRSESSNPSR